MTRRESMADSSLIAKTGQGWAYSTGSPTKAREMLVNATECPFCGYAGSETSE